MRRVVFATTMSGRTFAATAPGLAALPLLILTSDDGLAGASDELLRAIRASNGHRSVAKHVATDHGWSDKRIELEATVLTWIEQFR